MVSPSTASIDRVKKLGIYAREQVARVWLVDPLAQTLEVLVLESGRWVRLSAHAGAEVLRVPPFEAIEFDLTLLWADPPGPAQSSESS